jgi:hypothetical protein
VDMATARNLIDSMTTEVIVRDYSIEQVVPGPTMGYDDAVRLALADRAAATEQAAADAKASAEAKAAADGKAAAAATGG